MKRIAIFLVLALSACGLYFADTPRHGKGSNGSGTGPDAAVIGDAYVIDDAGNCNGINCPDAAVIHDGGAVDEIRASADRWDNALHKNTAEVVSMVLEGRGNDVVQLIRALLLRERHVRTFHLIVRAADQKPRRRVLAEQIAR